jgi:hypothetical protein
VPRRTDQLAGVDAPILSFQSDGSIRAWRGRPATHRQLAALVAATTLVGVVSPLVVAAVLPRATAT